MTQENVVNGPTKSQLMEAMFSDRYMVLEFDLVDKGRIFMKLKGMVPAKDTKEDLLILSTRKVLSDFDRHGYLLYNSQERSGTFVELTSFREFEKFLQR